MTDCITCGHDTPHAPAGIGVCESGCGCDGPCDETRQLAGWETRVLAADGAAERVAAIEAELREAD